MADSRSQSPPAPTEEDLNDAGGVNGKAGRGGRAALLDAIRQPIAEDAPCGVNVTYDDDFQQLKMQINSIESATEATDYERIVALGTKILAEKSKDLNAACYLALGLARERGIEGVAEGLGAVNGMVQAFWDDLYPAPRRMTSRRNALQFMADRLKEGLDGHGPPGEADREALLRAQGDLDALQAFCMEAMEEYAPAFSGLQAALGSAIDRLPGPDTKEEDAAPREGETPPAAGDGAFQRASEAKQAVAHAAAFLREQERTDPLPYRLLRALRWGALQEEPPSENGRTRLDPPLEQRCTYLAELLDKGEHAALVEEAEASFQNSPFHFWLDLQRLLAGALEALGTGYAPVQQAVRGETALLVERLPRLPALSFRDGTPFADSLTRDWLDAQIKSAGPPPAGESSGQDERARLLAEQYREARQRLGAGTLQEALATLHEGIGQDAPPKEHFRRRLYVADLCMKGKKPAVARPLLEQLGEDVQRHALDSWDPPLALEVWSSLYRCYRALVQSAPPADKQDLHQKADTVFDRICQVDPVHALTLGDA